MKLIKNYIKFQGGKKKLRAINWNIKQVNARSFGESIISTSKIFRWKYY